MLTFGLAGAAERIGDVAGAGAGLLIGFLALTVSALPAFVAPPDAAFCA